MKVSFRLLSALCAVAGIVFLSGCGDSPEEVVKNWHSAIREGNRTEAAKYVTGRDAAELNAWVIRVRQLAEKNAEEKKVFAAWDNFTFTGATIGGDTATMITPSVWGKSEKETLTLKKVDGKWKIDLAASAKQ